MFSSKFIIVSITTLLIAICLVFFVAITKGLGFPSEKNVSYTTGLLSYRIVSATTVHPLIQQKDAPISLEYSCEYTAPSSREWGICLEAPILKKFNGQSATIGWYTQPTFLWYKNPYKQVISIKVGETTLQNYENISNKINNFFRARTLALVLLIFLAIFLIYRIPFNTK